MVSGVKRERIEPQVAVPVVIKSTVIELSSSDSDSDADVGVGGGTGRTRVSNSGSVVGGLAKKAKADSALPLGFLDPLPLEEPRVANSVMRKGCRQFWKAGDFEDVPVVDSTSVTGSFDRSFFTVLL